MRLLVTGHRGRLGTAFTARCAERYDIVGFDRLDGDELGDVEALTERAAGCDAVLHLAAIPMPIAGVRFEDYFEVNVAGTRHVAEAAARAGVRRLVSASSTTVYGIENGIPFDVPITEASPFVSQSASADQLAAPDVALSYHVTKVMAEQVLAWYGLNRKLQTVALRFGPLDTVVLGTSASTSNAIQAIGLALEHPGELWYEAFTIVDPLDHMDISKARRVLGYAPETPDYSRGSRHSTLEDRLRAS